jgi:protein-export membrane protein SecD
MLAVYRLPGLVSVLALFSYVALMGIILVVSEINLSLPGIAGVILSIGMSIDANIIIFERIKEELRMGKPHKSAVVSGFSRAFTAILDSNLTTLIVAAVLWWFGSGPIKGFAATLFIGVCVSMISAVVISRLLLTRLADMNIKNPKLYGV